jgi:hypothetical protein
MGVPPIEIAGKSLISCPVIIAYPLKGSIMVPLLTTFRRIK